MVNHYLKDLYIFAIKYGYDGKSNKKEVIAWLDKNKIDYTNISNKNNSISEQPQSSQSSINANNTIDNNNNIIDNNNNKQEIDKLEKEIDNIDEELEKLLLQRFNLRTKLKVMKSQKSNRSDNNRDELEESIFPKHSNFS